MQEGCGQAGSETGKLPPHNNTPYDLAFFKRVFRALLAWSETLDVDAKLRPQWRTLLENVAKYPTATSETGQTVFAQANFTDGMPTKSNPECARCVAATVAGTAAPCLESRLARQEPGLTHCAALGTPLCTSTRCIPARTLI